MGHSVTCRKINESINQSINRPASEPASCLTDWLAPASQSVSQPASQPSIQPVSQSIIVSGSLWPQLKPEKLVGVSTCVKPVISSLAAAHACSELAAYVIAYWWPVSARSQDSSAAKICIRVCSRVVSASDELTNAHTHIDIGVTWILQWSSLQGRFGNFPNGAEPGGLGDGIPPLGCRGKVPVVGLGYKVPRSWSKNVILYTIFNVGFNDYTSKAWTAFCANTHSKDSKNSMGGGLNP